MSLLPELGLVEMSLIVFISFTILTALVMRVVYPRVQKTVQAIAPTGRARVLTFLSALPLVVGLVIPIVALLPSVIGAFAPSLDHCPAHAHAHVHLCLQHTPLVVSGPLALGLLLVALAPAAVGVIHVGRDLDGLRRLRTLADGRETPTGSQSLDLATYSPAFVTGFLRQRVIVSSWWRERLEPDDLARVIEHERAHIDRRDNLRKLLSGLFTRYHTRFVSQRLCGDLELACEQACDDETAQGAAERAKLAATLLNVVRQAPSAREAFELQSAGISHATSNLGVRVRALLDVAPANEGDRRIFRLAIVASMMLLLSSDPIHHAIETGFTWLGQ